jgi:hypothetical protein
MDLQSLRRIGCGGCRTAPVRIGSGDGQCAQPPAVHNSSTSPCGCQADVDTHEEMGYTHGPSETAFSTGVYSADTSEGDQARSEATGRTGQGPDKVASQGRIRKRPCSKAADTAQGSGSPGDAATRVRVAFPRPCLSDCPFPPMSDSPICVQRAAVSRAPHMRRPQNLLPTPPPNWSRPGRRGGIKWI